MQEDFKINVFFDDEGDEIENLLVRYLIQILNDKAGKSEYCLWKMFEFTRKMC